MARRALLLALDNYAHPRLAQLVAPRTDVRRLREQLLVLGYADAAINVHVSSLHGALSTAALRTRIRTFVQESRPGDELIIYVSGHGMDHDTARLVVPVDFDMEDPIGAAELLSDHWIYGIARGAPADAVLVIADSCRTGAELALKPKSLGKGIAVDAAAPVESAGTTDAPTIAMLYSCAKGRKSFATEGPDGESHFTRALCRVLATDAQAYTLGDIVAAVTRELASTEPRQEPFLDERHTIPGRLGPAAGLVIKESEAARLRQCIGRSQWCRLLEATPYWRLVGEASPGLTVQLQVLAVRAETMLADAVKHLPQDRWRSDTALRRLFDGLRHLLGDEPIDAPLAALLLAAPLVHEAMLAGLVLRLAASGHLFDPPRERSAATSVAPATRAWRQTLDRDDDLERRRAHLRLAGAAQDAEDLLAWQLWSFAYGAGELWAYAPGKAPGASGWLNDLLDELLRPAPMPQVTDDSRVMQLLERRRLVRLGRLMFVDAEDIDADASRAQGGLARKVQIGSGTQLWRVDEVEAAHLLSLVATLALDARRLPVLVADQLGQGDGFDLPALHRDLDQAAWQRPDATLTLKLSTAFPTSHAVLGGLVDQAERHRHRLSLGGRVGDAIAARLPAAILDTGLEPEVDENDRPRFDPRHVRFTLDQHRVLRLLLGEKLYGDPAVALRELYQNAMDACRYRRARAALVAKSKRRQSSYVGRIAFSAGHREKRPFIACQDNGIGMGDRHLRDLFARAGRRFTDSHEFHLDYAQWQEAGIPFWPNSRFGIGVLSYFMLADEILIETRRVETDGLARPDDGIEVRITGSGALFRIRRNPAVLDGEGGSRVTLYLKDPAARPDTVLRSVLEWLWLPEVETTIDRPDAFLGDVATAVLKAGIPTAACISANGGVLLPVPGTEGSLGQPRLFWAPMPRVNSDTNSVVLVDGIRTAIDDKPADHMHRALLANLTEELAGDVGVDRSRVRPPEVLGTWMRQAVDVDGGHALVSWRDADPTRLTRLALARPEPIEQFDADLRAGRIVAGEAPVLCVFGQSVSTYRIGLSIADGLLDSKVDSLTGRRQFDRWSTLSINPLKFKPVLHPFVADRLVALCNAGVSLPASLGGYAAYLQAIGRVEPLPLAVQWPVQCVVGHGESHALAPSTLDRIAMSSGDTVTRLSLGHVVRIATAYGCHYAELARRVAPLVCWGVLDFDPAALARLDDLPQESKIFVASVFKRRDGSRLSDPIGWKDLLDGSSRPMLVPEQLRNRLREARPLAELGFISNTDMGDLERLVAALTQAAALGLEPGFNPRLLLRGHVGVQHLVKALHRDRHDVQVPGIVRETFLPWVDAGLLHCDPELIAELDALTPAAAKLVDDLAVGADDVIPHRFVLLKQMLKQGCDAADVPDILAALGRVRLVSADLDVALFVDAFRAVQVQPNLAKVIDEFDDDFFGPLTAMLPLACSFLLGISVDALSQLLRPLQRAGIIDIDMGQLAQMPEIIQTLPVLAALSDIDIDRAHWVQHGIDAAKLHHVAVALSMPPARLAQLAKPLALLGVLRVDLDAFASRRDPHRFSATLMSRDGDGKKPWRSSLSAFELAFFAHGSMVSVNELAGALEDLALCGVEVSDARQYADWLIANPQPPAGLASPTT